MSLAQFAIAVAALAFTAVVWALRNTRSNEHRLATLETKIELFWKVIEENAVSLLHRDDTPGVDELLNKAADKSLTRDEAFKLIEELKTIEADRTRSKGESTMALVLRAVLVARYHD